MPTQVYNRTQATAIREEWTDAVGRLVESVAGWAAEKAWQTRITERPFDEEAIGAYATKVLEIDVPEYEGRVYLEPVARIVLGGAGRVDLYVWPTLARVLLLRDPGALKETGSSSWMIVTESRLKLKAEWGKQTFFDIVTEWLDGQ